MQGEHVETHLTPCQYPPPLSPLPPSPSSLSMSLPPSVVNVPIMPDDAGADPIDPATLSKIGGIMYDRKEGSYKLEWETSADFERWLTHEQQAIGIEIQ